MTPGTTASLICPACGQAFLSMQQSMEGMVQCPHCAHNALRGYFGTQAQVAGVAQVRRRVSQPQPVQSPPAPVQQPPQYESHAFAQAVGGLQPRQMAMPPITAARPALQPSQALLPTGAPPPQPDEFVRPQHLRTSPWRNAFILLGFAGVCGGALWLWWDSVNVPAVKQGEAPTPPPERKEVQKSPVVPQTETARAVIPAPDVGAMAADAKTLVTELFAAETAEGRAACIHEADKYGAEIEGQFGATGAQKTELRLLSRIPGMPQTLPGRQPVPLFKLVTSTCATGALIRLETGADGRRRISWPLLFETHSQAQAAFMKQPAEAAAAWFHVGLRPSHGLDIAAELRGKYLTFDVQVSAGSEPHFVACVERDTPLGRYLDRETEWGKSYLARLLVRRLDIPSAAPCLLVIDCEGSPER